MLLSYLCCLVCFLQVNANAVSSVECLHPGTKVKATIEQVNILNLVILPVNVCVVSFSLIAIMSDFCHFVSQ